MRSNIKIQKWEEDWIGKVFLHILYIDYGPQNVLDGPNETFYDGSMG